MPENFGDWDEEDQAAYYANHMAHENSWLSTEELRRAQTEIEQEQPIRRLETRSVEEWERDQTELRNLKEAIRGIVRHTIEEFGLSSDSELRELRNKALRARAIFAVYEEENARWRCITWGREIPHSSTPQRSDEPTGQSDTSEAGPSNRTSHRTTADRPRSNPSSSSDTDTEGRPKRGRWATRSTSSDSE